MYEGEIIILDPPERITRRYISREEDEGSRICLTCGNIKRHTCGGIEAILTCDKCDTYNSNGSFLVRVNTLLKQQAKKEEKE